MFDQARALDSAMRSSESYATPQPSFSAAVPSCQSTTQAPVQSDPNFVVATVQFKGPACFFCGNAKHPR